MRHCLLLLDTILSSTREHVLDLERLEDVIVIIWRAISLLLLHLGSGSVRQVKVERLALDVGVAQIISTTRLLRLLEHLIVRNGLLGLHMVHILLHKSPRSQISVRCMHRLQFVYVRSVPLAATRVNLLHLVHPSQLVVRHCHSQLSRG